MRHARWTIPALLLGLLAALAAHASDNPLYDAAVAAMQSGDFEAAATRFEQLVDENPNWAPGILSLGQCYFALGRMDQGQARFRRAKEADPSVDLYRAYVATALLHDRAERHHEAAFLLEQALPLAPAERRRETVLRLSRALLLDGDAGAAREALESYVASDGQDYDVAFQLGLACQRAGDYDCALSGLREARRLDDTGASGARYHPSLARWARYWALRPENASRRDELLRAACDDARRWLEAAPHDADARAHYAENLFDLDDAAAVLERFLPIAGQEPNDCATGLFIARAYNLQKDGVRAAEWASRAIFCEESDARAHVALATALLFQLPASYDDAEQARAGLGLVARALEAAERAVELGPGNDSARELVERARAARGRLQEVERDLTAFSHAQDLDDLRRIEERCKRLWWKRNNEGAELSTEEAAFYADNHCARHAPR